MEILEILLSASFWAAVVRIASPLIFATMGELICERAGVLNLGIEGIMTMGAMAGWLTVYMGGDLWTGLLVAAICGGLMGLLHAMLTVPLGLSQHVSGLGITLFASALSYYLYRLIVTVGDLPPTIEPFRPLDIPILSDIPVLGPILFSQTIPTYLALLSVVMMAYVLARTPLGLAIRMTGENPHAVEAQGLNPIRIRIGAVVAGSAAAATAAAFVSCSQSSRPRASSHRGGSASLHASSAPCRCVDGSGARPAAARPTTSASAGCQRPVRPQRPRRDP